MNLVLIGFAKNRANMRTLDFVDVMCFLDTQSHPTTTVVEDGTWTREFRRGANRWTGSRTKIAIYILSFWNT
jgi:hypothetical protein